MAELKLRRGTEDRRNTQRGAALHVVRSDAPAQRRWRQSVRSAVSGSTRIARRAGTALATAPAVTIAAIAASHATGSNGVTP